MTKSIGTSRYRPVYVTSQATTSSTLLTALSLMLVHIAVKNKTILCWPPPHTFGCGKWLLLGQSSDVQTGADTAMQGVVTAANHTLHHCSQHTQVVKHLQRCGHLRLVLRDDGNRVVISDNQQQSASVMSKVSACLIPRTLSYKRNCLPVSEWQLYSWRTEILGSSPRSQSVLADLET